MDNEKFIDTTPDYTSQVTFKRLGHFSNSDVILYYIWYYVLY